MMRLGCGSICNIVSPSGIRGQAGQCNYSASKGGVIAFTKALSREVGRFGIRINAVCPGVIPSAMSDKYIRKEERRLLEGIPLGRFGRPEEIAVDGGLL
jgi:3-oxoacyl-[acyl-carrier protein] reductase